MESLNVTPQFPPAHLESLFDFAVEVTGRLGELRQRSNRGQVLVADDRAISKIPYPASFEDPNFLGLRPSRARGKDAPTQLKASRIEFKHRESAKEVLRGVEEIVVINPRALSENPALRMSVRLRRAPFDQVMEGVLPLVCIRQIRVVEHDHSHGQRQTGKKQGCRQPVHTDPAGFDGYDFIALAHDPQRHENGHQRSQGRELVEQIRSKVAEIIDNDQERDAMAGYVVQQLEERERLKQKNERSHQEREIIKEQ